MRKAKQDAWEDLSQPCKEQVKKSVELMNDVASKIPHHTDQLHQLIKELSQP